MLASVNGQHDDLGVCRSKIDRVGKSRQHRAAGVAVHTPKQEWVVDDSGNKGVNGLTEFTTQTGPAGLLPRVHFECVVLGLGPEDNFARHVYPNNLARTSAQAIADVGLATCSAHRRSSSARCPSVSSNSASCSTPVRLSHSAIASSARSPAGSVSNSVRGLDGITGWSHAQVCFRNVVLSEVSNRSAVNGRRSPAAAQDRASGRLVHVRRHLPNIPTTQPPTGPSYPVARPPVLRRFRSPK